VRLLVDEGVAVAIVARLRTDGHDVIYVAELAPGMTDSAVLELASAEQRRAAHGVLLVRLPDAASSTKADAVALALAEHGDEMAKAFSVVSPGSVRIRHAV
jgi:hypothetical protein